MDLGLKKIPWWGQVGLFAIVAAGAIGAYFYFYDSAARAELATRQRQLDGLRAEIVKAQTTARKLQEFQAQVADLQARLDGLKAVLPEQKDVGDLLRRIQTLATQSNLEIRGFKPQAIVTKAMHAEWPISLEIEGTYHDLGFFFDKVSKVPRIINVSNIVVKGEGTRRGRTDDPTKTSTIVAECLATTFVLLENPAPAATAAPARPGARPAATKPAAAAPANR